VVTSTSKSIEMACEEEPEQEPADGSKYHFVFLVDRSGSMATPVRRRDETKTSYMEITKEALNLFI
jgi:hypothetical protein